MHGVLTNRRKSDESWQQVEPDGNVRMYAGICPVKLLRRLVVNYKIHETLRREEDPFDQFYWRQTETVAK